MRIMIIGKFPPIQGGVSRLVYWATQDLAVRGNDVVIVTNAEEVEPGFRQVFLDEDFEQMPGHKRIRLENIDAEPGFIHIPNSPAYLSRIYGRALRVAQEFRPNLVIGSYFEPYGVVAVCVAERIGCPSAIMHAGSDIGRLSGHVDLRAAYADIISRATRVITSKYSEKRAAILTDLGIAEDQRIYPGTCSVETVYSEPARPIDITRYTQAATHQFMQIRARPDVLSRVLDMNRKVFDRDKPTIGIYGKIGNAKGTLHLHRVLTALAEENRAFNFLCIAAGWRGSLAKYWEMITGSNVACHTWLLPPVPPWRIPEFIAACDAVFFLETDFPITFHNPRVPREVLAQGKCLILSIDQVDRLGFGNALVPDKNVCMVDINDHDDMLEKIRNLIDEPEAMGTIARYGKLLSRHVEDRIPSRSCFTSAIDIMTEQGLFDGRQATRK